MKMTRTLLAPVLAALLMAPAAAAGADYHVSIPDSFSKTGDGMWAQGSDTIHIWTTQSGNAVALIRSDMSKAKSSGMTLGNQGQVSGIAGSFAIFFATKGGKGFYEKAVETCGGLAVMRVDYPASGADSFPSYLDRLASSFTAAC